MPHSGKVGITIFATSFFGGFMTKNILLFAILGLPFFSCDTFDKEEEAVPSFVYVEKVDVKTREGEGSDSHKITAAHVYANDQFVGVVEPPGYVAVYKAGKTKISVFAGIKNNGISEARIIYPNYAPFIANITLKPGQLTDFSEDSASAEPGTGNHSYPVVFYYEQATIYNEAFESPGMNVDTTAGSLAGIVKTSEPGEAFEGTSAKISLSTEKYFFDAESNWDPENIPRGVPIYVELDYKGTVPFEVGVISRQPLFERHPAMGIYPSETWNKIYIDITQEIGILNSFEDVEIYIQAVLPQGEIAGDLFLDNIKLVYIPS